MVQNFKNSPDFPIKQSVKLMIKGDLLYCFNIMSQSQINIVTQTMPEVVCPLEYYNYQEANVQEFKNLSKTSVQIRGQFLVDIDQETETIRSGIKLEPVLEFQLEDDPKENLDEEKQNKFSNWINFRWKNTKETGKEKETQKEFEMKEAKFKIVDKGQFQIFLKKLKKKFIFQVIADLSNDHRPVRKKMDTKQITNIYFVQRKSDNKDFAVKAISKKKFEPQELDIVKKLNHPNICRQKKLYKTKKTCYMLLEFYEQNLGEWLKRKDKERIQISTFLQVMLKVLEHMKKKGVMHRDIKPDNIMLKCDTGNLEPVLIDFDLAENIEAQAFRNPCCGTPGYIAPQILGLARLKKQEGEKKSKLNKDDYNETCDMFSLGATLYVLLTSRPLFKESEDEKLLLENRECQLNLQKRQEFQMLPKLYQEILIGMLKKNPKQRLTPQQALKSPMFFLNPEKKTQSQIIYAQQELKV